MQCCLNISLEFLVCEHFSPDLAENEATFAITTGGIADAKE